MDAMVVWMGEDPMVPGTRYLFKQTTKVVPGALQSLRYQVDVNTLHREPAPSLQLNEIGRCEIQLDDILCLMRINGIAAQVPWSLLTALRMSP